MEPRFARSLFAASFALTASLVGCAAPEDSEELDHEDLVANADEVVVDEPDLGSQRQAVIYNEPYECTSQTLRCMPDLAMSLKSVVRYEAGNTAGVTPGTYVSFSLTNLGGKSAEAFEVDIMNGANQVLSTRSFTGLAAGATKTITHYVAPGCGWGVKALADADKTVVEYSETNNLKTYWDSCPVSIPAPDDGYTTIGGTVPITTLP